MQLVSDGQPGAFVDEVVMGKTVFTTKLYGITDNSSSQNW